MGLAAPSKLRWILLGAAVVLVATLGWFVWKENTTVSDDSGSTVVVAKKTPSPTATVTAGMTETATTVADNKVKLDKAGAYTVTLPAGYAVLSSGKLNSELSFSELSLTNVADSLSHNLGKTVKGTNHAEYSLSQLASLPVGFSGKEEKLSRAIAINEFNTKLKSGDMVPAGQDRIELSNAVITSGLASGYFLATASSLQAASNCAVSKNSAWVPLSNTSTVRITAYECNENRIAQKNEEGGGSRPKYEEARKELDEILKTLLETIKPV